MTVYILNTIKNSFEYLGRWDVVALFSIFLLFTDYLQSIESHYLYHNQTLATSVHYQ